MLTFDANLLYRISNALLHGRVLMRKQADENGEDSKIDAINKSEAVKWLNNMLGMLKDVNAPLTEMSVKRTIKLLEKGINYKRGISLLNDIDQRISDELTLIIFLAIDKNKSQFFKSAETHFGTDFLSRYPSAIFELEEAAKCLALDRPTAAVFHLMRIMEIGVKAAARCLQIPDPTKPAERNWGFMLGEIGKGIKLKWPTTTDRAHGDGAFFDSLHASLDSVKNPWRNATMHVENKYTDEEAEHIFIAVKGFMKKLASRLDENGDPKA